MHTVLHSTSLSVFYTSVSHRHEDSNVENFKATISKISKWHCWLVCIV